ncbi:hypothetical protein KPL70_008594 [Citrus sinensis]|nr:hypothetical protein KPL70_008594 [Citrus sinensis]
MSESSETLLPYENPSLLKTVSPLLAKDRSTKKARFRAHGADADNPAPLSFKDALVHPDQYGHFDDIEMEEEWDFEPGDVTVGRNIGYKALCNRLKVMWHQIHDFSVIDLENNYFLIRLKSLEDVVYALTEGPWVIFGHYLIVQPWTPHFDSTITDLDSAIVWIRLPDMAFHLYDKRILRKISQLVGTVIKIDYHTELRERGKFARMAVRISLSQPLLSQFNLDGKIQRVEYEGLPVICYQCGKYGYNSFGCPSKKKMNEANTDTSKHILPANMTGEKDDGVDMNTKNSEKFGPWMMVLRRGKPKFVVEKENIAATERNQRNNIPVTSRFDVLSEDVDTNNSVEAAVTIPNLEPSQRQPKSITDHFHTRKNLHLKTPSILKPQNQLSKGKQVAKSNHPVLKQQTITASTSMHASLRPNNTRILNLMEYVPIPKPSSTLPNFPREPTSTLNLTTLDPQKHTAITFSNKTRETEENPLVSSRNLASAKSKQQPHIPQLNEHAEGKDEGDIRLMEDYAGDLQFTFVYTSPNSAGRRALWYHLNNIAESMHDPWIMGVILIQFYMLQKNVEFSGPRYTWTRGNLSKRLDRAMSNQEWILKFDNYSVTHLPQVESDHRPILVRFERQIFRPRNVKPFRFLAAWITDNRFGDFIQESWQKNIPYSQAASTFTSKVVNWNREIFGNIFKRKKQLLARIGGIQKALESKPLRSLYRLEANLKQKLEELLSQEELLWYQKSRRDWISYGDRNTSFFHQKTITRRARNRINAIKDDRDTWLYDTHDIKSHAVSFFSTLYESDQAFYRPYSVQGCFPQIDPTRLSVLTSPVDNEEIRQAVLQMKPVEC